LPATLDPSALATSLQQIVLSKSGVTIENIAVPQELQATGETKALAATPQTISFSFVVSGSYDKIHQMVTDIERTIRPIQINSINITGTDASLRASVNATTYYQPSKTVTVQEKTIQ
jgi:Tfp pilus assembly protein PilO